MGIVKACEPVFAAAVGFLVPPMDIKPPLAYLMLVVIVSGVGLACVKEGKGVDINTEALAYASLANVAAALKGKLGGSVTKSLKADKKKNMDSANVYAVMNILSFLFTVPVVVMTELPTLAKEWDIAVAEHGAGPLLTNIAYPDSFFTFTTSLPSRSQLMLVQLPRLFLTQRSVLLLWYHQFFSRRQWNATQF